MNTLNFRDYWDVIGTDEMMKVLARAGCKLQYARQFRIGVKIPGRVTAMSILDAARQETPGWEPDLELMLRGVDRAIIPGSKIRPSKEFLKTKRKVAK